MSVQAISWVLDHSPTRGTDRLVLIALANHAGKSPVNGAWEAWPGVATIAREAGIARTRTVQHALARLVAEGHIERRINDAPDRRIRPDQRPNLYRILVIPSPAGTPVDNQQNGVSPHDTPLGQRGVASRQNGVSLGDKTGCRQATPKPSLNQEGTPSGENVLRADSPDGASTGRQGELIEQAILEAARRYAEHRSERESVANPTGLAEWWRRENGDRVAVQAHRLLRDYDLSVSQLAAALLAPNARWLAGCRRRHPEDGSTQ